MKLKLATIVAFLICSWPAMGQFQVIELAHEVPLSQFTVPVTRNGILNFRSCDDCQSFSARLTPETRFIVNQRDVELREFRQQVMALGKPDDHYLTILQHVEKNTITFISISL